MTPNGKPSPVPRIQAGIERFHSRRVMCTRPMVFIIRLLRPSYSAT